MAQVTSPRHAPGSVWWRALSTDAIEHEGVNMALAQRLSRLGTETTFAVALSGRRRLEVAGEPGLPIPPGRSKSADDGEFLVPACTSVGVSL